jgi:DNA polymerase-1
MLAALDTETYLIAAHAPAPPLVCGTFATEDGESGLLPGLDVADWLASWLARGGEITGANLAYDAFVIAAEYPELLPAILEAYAAGRMHDVQLREKLLDIRKGCFRTSVSENEHGELVKVAVKYSLADVALRRTGMVLDKSADSWRLRFNELHAVPVASWPREAREYACDDAIATLKSHQAQELEAGAYLAIVEPDQCRAHFALRAIGARGMLVDMDAVDALERELATKRAEHYQALVDAGIYRASGTKDMKRLRALVSAAYEAKGDEVPLTSGGKSGVKLVSTSQDALSDSGDELLQRAATEAKLAKTITGFMPALRVGANMPLSCEYEPLLETARTSSRGIRHGKQKGPQFQNFPRGGGVRECFVARPGFVLCSVDYSQIELCTLAQIVYDMGCGSVLRDALNTGRDVHLDFACKMRGWNYEATKSVKKREPYKHARQSAKAANYGFPGGLGVKRFVNYAWANYEVRVSEAEARAAQRMWRELWPDCYEYQRRTSAAIGDGQTIGVTIDRTGFERGRCIYTEACNTPFQHLAAIGAKRAVWRAVREGAQHGIFPVVFAHDEIIAELPEDGAHDAAHMLARIMIEEMQALVPDVLIAAEPAIARRWYKGMEAVHDANGRLVCWEPAA